MFPRTKTQLSAGNSHGRVRDQQEKTTADARSPSLRLLGEFRCSSAQRPGEVSGEETGTGPGVGGFCSRQLRRKGQKGEWGPPPASAVD